MYEYLEHMFYFWTHNIRIIQYIDKSFFLYKKEQNAWKRASSESVFFFSSKDIILNY